MEMKEVFEKAGDSVSKFAKSVGDSSKKLATKVKLNKNIHDLERVKETAYMEMGKQYFLTHADAAEEPYAEWVQKIVEANEQIAKCKQEIAALDDLVLCPSCGKEMAEGQKFCPNCGAKNEAAEQPKAEEVSGEVLSSEKAAEETPETSEAAATTESESEANADAPEQKD